MEQKFYLHFFSKVDQASKEYDNCGEYIGKNRYNTDIIDFKLCSRG